MKSLYTPGRRQGLVMSVGFLRQGGGVRHLWLDICSGGYRLVLAGQVVLAGDGDI